MLDLPERLSPVSLDAFTDLLDWWQAEEPDMSPPLALGWDIKRQWPDAQGFELWSDLMHSYEPRRAAYELLKGDPRSIVTTEQYDAELSAQWSRYDRPKHPTDSLIIEEMLSARESGWRVGGPALAATEAILDDLAKSSGAERAKSAKSCDPVLEFLDYLAANPYTGPRMINTDLLTSSRNFIDAFVAPEYLIDGAVQRRYFYSMTAQTGVGKTSIAMRWMAHVVTGRPIGETEVQKGRVLYLAGENPDDVRARWLVLTHEMGIDPSTADVTWVVGAKDLGAVAEQFVAEVNGKGLDFAYVVVDTAAAYNMGDDENSNNQAGAYARQLRSLTTLPGGPCVVVLCHPTKRAADDDLLPRGGGAFLAEVDGNLAVMRKDALLVVTPFGKFRGDMSWVQRYEIGVVKDHPKLKDARGRQMASVVARPVGAGAAAAMEKRTDADMETVLSAIDKAPISGLTPTDIARLLNWTFGAKAELNSNKVKRILKRLLHDKLVKEAIGKWSLTPTGQKALNAIDVAKAISLPPAPPMSR